MATTDGRAPNGASTASDEQEWSNPENWKLGMFYFSRRDSRDWVSRRPFLGRRPYGVAPNFAKPRARRAVAAAFAVLIAALAIAATFRDAKVSP